MKTENLATVWPHLTERERKAVRFIYNDWYLKDISPELAPFIDSSRLGYALYHNVKNRNKELYIDGALFSRHALRRTYTKLRKY